MDGGKQSKMSEMIKYWLIQLYDEAIEEQKESIKNNHLWILGAATKEEKMMFIQNEKDMQEYIEVLTELKKNIEEEL